MPARLTVLASGSAGNASLLEAGGFGLLIDCGLGPRVLAGRLAVVGLSWRSIHAVVLTHTHGDHWNHLTLAHLRSLHVPLYAHAGHHDYLSRFDGHSAMRRAGLLRTFADGEPLAFSPLLTGRPVAVPHDAEPTFAFRFDAGEAAVGFASDLGHVTPTLRAAFEGVSALAVEFNHDVRMQRASCRPQPLIDRVLGKFGHLSNVQAAEFAGELARAAGLSHLVQLHLSRECNTPELAAAVARTEVSRSTGIVTATQNEPALPVVFGSAARGFSRRRVQPPLPGMEIDHTAA